MATSTTKADLEARVAELEAQLASSHGDPRESGMVKLVGLLKGVKDITRPDGGKRTVCAFLVNTTIERRGEQELRVDLPIDSVIATDNGKPIATDILSVASSTEWARVAIYGYWTVFGEITRNERGFPVAHRRQLRAQRIEVLSSQPAGEALLAEVIEPPFSHEPTSEEVPF